MASEPASAAAAGIAVINSIGNLAGFAGPYAMGWIKDATGSFTGGLLLIAALAVVALTIVLLLGHDHARAREKRRMWKAPAEILERLGLGHIEVREE